MKSIIEDALLRAQEALQLETTVVNQLLWECKVEKVQPPKDYWHNKVKLENKIKALKLLLETTK